MNITLRNVFSMSLMTVLLTAPLTPSYALTVFDPSNFSQNVLSAIRTLQSNVNEANMIANQLQSLANEAANLTPLDYSTVNQFQTQFTELFAVVSEIQGLAQDYASLESNFAALFPDYSKVTGTLSSADVAADLLKWIENNRNTLEGAAKSGAAILKELPQDQAELATLIDSSQGARGARSAIQAGNQISAVIAGQLLSLNTQMATFQQAHTAYLLEQNNATAAARRRLEDVMKDWDQPVTAAPVPANPF